MADGRTAEEQENYISLRSIPFSCASNQKNKYGFPFD
jgi:hypothetical protein